MAQEKLLWVNPYGWQDMDYSSNGVNGVAQEGINRLRQKGLDIVTVGPHVGDDKHNVADVTVGNTLELSDWVTKITGTAYPVSLPFRKERVAGLVLASKPDGVFIEQPDQGFHGHSVISGTQIREDGQTLIPVMARFHGAIYNETADLAYRIFLKSLKLARRPRFTKLGVTDGISNTVLDNLQLCLVTSEAIKRVSEIRYGKREYKILPNGIDVDKFAPKDSKHPAIDRWRMDGKEIILIAMGRIEKRKGVVHGLEAYKTIKAKRPNTRLMIVGEGPEKKSIEEKVSREKIEDVYFTGRLSREEYGMALRTADVGLYPAIGGEGWGIVVGEGLASGLLSVVSNISGYDEVTERGQPFALMAEPKNPADIAEKTIKILDLSEEVRKNLKREAAEYIRSRFAWDIVINQLAGHIQIVLNNRAKVNCEETREKYARKAKFFPPSGTLFIARK
jgi:glycosyltransferase involved in cell wall biosynthesis